MSTKIKTLILQKTNFKTLTFFLFPSVDINFTTKNNLFCIKKLISTDGNKIFFFLCKNAYNKLYFSMEIIKKYKLYFFYNLYLYCRIKSGELELKGLNYRFSKFWSNLLLDLGQSHFQVFFHSLKHVLVFVWKKKLKRVLLISFNNQIFSSLINFFWYNLKSVGPYKLKGFQFINEWLKLKQGKKPFK